jgi:hypothetical protein
MTGTECHVCYHNLGSPPTHRPVHLFREPIQWVNIAHVILEWPLKHGSPGQLNQSGEKENNTETGSAGTSSKQE